MDLPPAERGIYLELENYLKSLEMISKSTEEKGKFER
jgi:hypothetical protein